MDRSDLIRYVDDIPSIDHLIEKDLEVIKTYVATTPPSSEEQDVYWSRKFSNSEVEDLLRPYFPTDTLMYHYIGKNIFVHRDSDWGRFACYNYLISDGNGVTQWFDDDMNLIHEERIEVGRWHWFNSSVYHTVVGIETPRYGLTMSIL